MGRKLLIMPPYQPVEYHGSMEREIERRSDMYRDPDMRSAPYRTGGGYNDRAGVMNYGGSEMRMGEPYYDDARYSGGYSPEMRRGRDSRGRYTSVSNEYEPGMGGRRRRADGTYMTMGGYEGADMNGGRYAPPYVPPVYERRERGDYRPMNKIGFSMGGDMSHETRTDYKSDASYMPMDEMTRHSGERMSGYGEGSGYIPMTKEMAMEWTQGMENEDGTMGPHWSMEQTKTVMAQEGIECDPLEFYLAMNMMYSDYAPVAKKLNVNNIKFYSCMAKAFLNDKDAQPDKLARYYEYIAK